MRSSERVNSIRRSNALERMKGKRWNTRSRMSAIVGGHQSDRLDQAGKQFRLAQRLLQKHLAIESPMLGADDWQARYRR